MQKPKSFRRILSSCRSASDLEHFAKRHDRAFAAGLDLELSKAPCVSTVLYLFERVELEALFGLLREWTIAMLAEQDRNFGQLICAGKPCAILPRSPMALMAQRGLSPRTRSMRGSWVWRLPRPPMTPANPTRHGPQNLAQHPAARGCADPGGCAAHLAIENEWHWARDAQLGEDAHRYANRIGAPVFAFLRTIVMNVCRRAGYRSIRQGLRELGYDIQWMLALGGVASRVISI